MTSDNLKEEPREEFEKLRIAFRRQLIRTRVISLSLGALLGGAGVGIAGSASNFAYQGDTPVVLVGGSVTVKEAYRKINLKWSPSGNGYSTTLKHPIDVIVVKQDSSKDKNDSHEPDGDKSSTDLGTPVPVPNDAKKWEVDLFTVDAGGVESAGPKLSWSSLGSNIELDNNGGVLVPCPASNRRIGYTACDNQPYPKFSRVNIIITDKNGANSTTPLTCADSTGSAGHCRIVLRYNLHLF